MPATLQQIAHDVEEKFNDYKLRDDWLKLKAKNEFPYTAVLTAITNAKLNCHSPDIEKMCKIKITANKYAEKPFTDFRFTSISPSYFTVTKRGSGGKKSRRNRKSRKNRRTKRRRY